MEEHLSILGTLPSKPSILRTVNMQRTYLKDEVNMQRTYLMLVLLSYGAGSHAYVHSGLTVFSPSCAAASATA